MPRTTFNKALSHAIRSRYDLSNWRRSLRKIEEETKSIRYSVAINIGSNGRVNDGRVGVKSPRIERLLSTINQPTNQPAIQPASRLRSSSRAMASGWKAGMWVTGIANNRGGALVVACVCLRVCVRLPFNGP